MKAADKNFLRGPLLRSVSRSFYLSLRFLPKALRDPLSLAYLLARATDTIADTAEPPVSLRTEALRDLAGAIQGTTAVEIAGVVGRSFAVLQTNEAEQTLMAKLPALLSWLGDLSAVDRDEVRNVLAKINRGQTLDLERFETGEELRGLRNASELEEYIYLVAGSVGEFWTRLCFAHMRNFSTRPEPEMRELGVRYGKGLQLVNILRDVGEDLASGRCYLPVDELAALGVSPTDLLREPALAMSVFDRWREKAEHDIAAGMEYACAIENRRVRFATALPALIGARTLSLLQEAGAEALTRKVKVSRAEVRKMIASSALASRRSLRAKFTKFSR